VRFESSFVTGASPPGKVPFRLHCLLNLQDSAAADWLAQCHPWVRRASARSHGFGLANFRDCRVGGGAPKRWPPSAAQTARTVFPYAAFTKTRHYKMRARDLPPP